MTYLFKRRRRTCAVCGKTFSLDATGKIPNHTVGRGRKDLCPGSLS